MSEEVTLQGTLPPGKSRRHAKQGVKPRRITYFTLSSSVYLWVVIFFGVLFISTVFFGMTHFDPQQETGIFVRFESCMTAAREHIHYCASWCGKPINTIEIHVGLTPTSRLIGEVQSRMPELTFLHGTDSLSFEGFGNLLEKGRRSANSRYQEWPVLTIDKDALELMSYDELVGICDLVKQKGDAALSITTAQ